ncbi:ROK family protein [Streptobacillus moniliformis]|uniref:ROK family protein n=1 Tax=Streptobacillus moniliformis TaxID=34105 RepID=UPI0007EEE02F|nr:ROK family protein [Streptobacillus moniliformis]
MKIICFDIGGTNIKYAIIEDISNIEVKTIETRITKDDNYILEDVLKIIELNKDVKAVGISTAGVVNSKTGEVIFAGPTIPKYTGTKFKEIIEAKFGIETFVENDVNSAAFGEYCFGDYKGSMFMLTIGTGVGGSLILDGKVFSGASMTAGEIGYMPLNDGHFQDFSSATYLTNYVSERLNKKVDGKYIFESAKNGDKLCTEAIDKMVYNLTTGLLNIVYMINPDNIVIGGGITAQGEYLEEKILKVLDERIIGKQFKSNVKLANLKNSAGIYGIYNIVRKEMK